MQELVDSCFVGFVKLVDASLVGYPVYRFGDVIVPVLSLDHMLPEELAEVSESDCICFVACDRSPVDIQHGVGVRWHVVFVRLSVESQSRGCFTVCVNVQLFFTGNLVVFFVFVLMAPYV